MERRPLKIEWRTQISTKVWMAFQSYTLNDSHSTAPTTWHHQHYKTMLLEPAQAKQEFESSLLS